MNGATLSAAGLSPQSRAELVRHGNRRFLRRRQFGHPVAEHERRGRGLGNEGQCLRIGDVVANPGPSWHINGTGDFNGDGQTDIVLQKVMGKSRSGRNNGQKSHIGGGVANPGRVGTRSEQAISPATASPTSCCRTPMVGGDLGNEWRPDRPIRHGQHNPGPIWRAVGTGDFYGDGNTDILFQNTNWQGRGLGDKWQQPVGPMRRGRQSWPAWQAVGTGDFNSDGKTDIVLQNNNGRSPSGT